MKQDDMQDLRSTRDRFVVDIRKSQRQQKFQQSRKRLSSHPEDQSRKNKCVVVVDERYREIIVNLASSHYQATNLHHYLARLTSEDIVTRHEAIIAVRTIVSGDPSQSYIQQVIDYGAVPTILAYMKESSYPQLQFQACWIVTNIAGGSNLQCQSVVDKGCIDLFLSLLYEDRPFLNEQALWGIGNLAADCSQFRDDILMKGGHQCIIRLVQNTNKASVLRQGVWALSNFCRGSPAPKYQIIKPIIPVICRSIVSGQLVGDQLMDALWAIANSTEGKKSKVQRVLDIPNFVNKIIELCYIADYQVLVPALRIIGNISTGNSNQTETLLRLDILKLLEGLLQSPKKVVRRQSCWTISNICAGTKQQIQQVLARPNLLQQVSHLFMQDEQKVKRQICYIFANMANMGNPQSVFTVIKQLSILEIVIEIIQTNNQINILEPALQALYDILFMAQKVAQPNPLVKIMENTMGFYERLEQLQHHESQQIYKTIVKIFQRFLNLQEDIVI